MAESTAIFERSSDQALPCRVAKAAPCVLAVLDSADEPRVDPPDTAHRVIAVIGERRAAHFVFAKQLVQRAAVGATES